MKSWGNNSLRLRMMLGVSGVIVLAALVFFAAIHPFISRQILQDEGQDLRIYAKNEASELNQYLSEAMDSLEKLAVAPEIRSMDRETIDHFFGREEVFGNPVFLWYMVLDGNGRVLSRPSKPTRIGEDRSDKDYFQEPIRTHRSYVAQVQVSKGDHISVHFSAPILSETGDVIGVLTAPVGFADRNPAMYHSVVNDSMPDFWEVFLVTRQGVLMAHSSRELKLLELEDLDYRDRPLVSQSLQKPVSLLKFNENGRVWYGATARVNLTGWTLGVQVPADVIIAQVHQLTNPIAVFILFFLGLLLMVSLVATHYFIRPLSDLTTSLTRFGLHQSVEPLEVKGSGEVAQAQQAFNGMIEERLKLEQEILRAHRLDSLGQMAGGVAHDFNNILTAITSNISLARLYRDNPEKLLEKLLASEQASLRAKGLTQQLLSFTKAGAPVTKSASMAEVIIDSSRFTLSGSRVRLKTSFHADLWPITIDLDQISQVTQNLVMNVREAMPQGGLLTIEAENVVIGPEDPRLLAGSYVRISFIDQGSGIPESIRGKIFDPYFTTKKTNCGLGLSVCYSIITKNNGSIFVDSAEGEGATIHLYLPAKAGRDVKVEEPTDEIEQSRSKGRILLLDDEPDILQGVAEMLELSGFSVETVTDGLEAVLRVQEAIGENQPFDLLILDLTIPGGMGGDEAFGRIREFSPETPAIVSSGYSDDIIMSKYADYGFAGVISKPYRFEDLIRAVQTTLGRKSRD
ncbi:MAG: response regulator [Proteobacteria bacterium]|nr:response regulator [Pseudomonadota bacterium]MBU1688505.1 response regulator [Pseudomonadota bacterium]